MPDLSSLQAILDEIPDKARVKRLITSWEADALDQRTICWSEKEVIDLKKKMEQHLTKHNMTTTDTKDELLTSKQACAHLKIGMTTFITYKNADLIEVANQIGNKHLFSRKHLDNFLRIPAHERNMRLANAPPKESRWGRKKKHLDNEMSASTTKLNERA